MLGAPVWSRTGVLVLVIQRFAPYIRLVRRIVTRFTTFSSSHPARLSHCRSLYDVSLHTSGSIVVLTVSLLLFTTYFRHYCRIILPTIIKKRAVISTLKVLSFSALNILNCFLEDITISS